MSGAISNPITSLVNLVQDTLWPKYKESGLTPFLQACMDGNLQVIQEYLRNGGDPDVMSGDGRTGLILACKYQKPNAATYLINHRAGIGFQDNIGWTALMNASWRPLHNVARLLITKGAPVDVKNRKGVTALMLDCYYGSGRTSKLLIGKGANVDLQDDLGNTALLYACRNGKAANARMLLGHGADPNLKLKTGHNPLVTVAGKDASLTRLLVEKGAAVNAQVENGWTALMEASRSGTLDTVKMLLDNGAIPEVQAKSGWNALMAACRENKNDIAKLLLPKVAKARVGNVNALDVCVKSSGWTTLMFACVNCKASTVQDIVDMGAELDILSKRGFTAMMLLAHGKFKGSTLTKRDMFASFKILYLAGARTDITKEYLLSREDALAIAKRKNMRECVDFLEFIQGALAQILLDKLEMSRKVVVGLYDRGIATMEECRRFAWDASADDLHRIGIATDHERQIFERHFAEFKYDGLVVATVIEP